MFHINGVLLKNGCFAFNMRSLITQIFAIGLLICLLNPVVLHAMADDSSSSDTIQITGEETWDEDKTISGIIEISSNAKLTIDSSKINIDEGTSIQIKSGGTLSIIDSELSQSNYTSTAISTITDNGELFIPAGDNTGTWVVSAKIIFADMNVKPEVKWENEEIWNQVSTNNITVSSSFSEEDEGAWVQIKGSPFEHPVILSVEITIDDDENPLIYDPWKMSHEGFMPSDTNTTQIRTWSIINEGLMELNRSSISGALLSGSGEFGATDSWYNRSSPILLENTSLFTIIGGGINGSATDEDIQSVLGASISWSNSTSGTGGLVDRWTTELGYCQKLILPAEGIQIEIQNLSYQGTTVNRVGTSAEDGTFTPISCDFNYKRLIEIVDSNGNKWTENATIKSVTWENSWGTYHGNNGSLGWSPEKEVLFENMPKVGITEVLLEEETGIVTDSVQVTIVMSNTGNSRAIVPVECKLSDGSSADISPQFPTVSIDPGQTGDVFVDWRIFNWGEETLTCSPMLPSGEGANLLGGGGSTSEIFSWTPAPTEVEDNDWMSTGLVIAIFVGIMLSVGYLVKQKPEEEIVAITTDIEDDSENSS